jgi:YggT family protein
MKERGVSMFIMTNFINATATIVDMILSIYMWILIARAIVSWVSPFSRSPVVYALIRLTDPVLQRIRGIFRLQGLGIDFSPMIAILVILFLQHFVVASLYDLARTM